MEYSLIYAPHNINKNTRSFLRYEFKKKIVILTLTDCLHLYSKLCLDFVN